MSLNNESGSSMSFEDLVNLNGEAMAIIYVPRKDELTGDNSSELTLETAAT